MSKIITIAIDAMGGDNSPDKTIEGVGIFLKKNNTKKDYLLNLYGDKDQIKEKLLKYKIYSNLIKITHTNSVVSDDETPLTAIKTSKNTMFNFNNYFNHKFFKFTFILFKKFYIKKNYTNMVLVKGNIIYQS